MVIGTLGAAEPRLPGWRVEALGLSIRSLRAPLPGPLGCRFGAWEVVNGCLRAPTNHPTGCTAGAP